MLLHQASRLSVFVILVFAATASASEQLTNQPIVSGQFQATIYTRSSPVIINRIFQWEIVLQDLQGKPIENANIIIRGGMPEHNHGLPTAPKVTKYLGAGKYLIEGVKFHMAGNWQLEFIVSTNDQQEVLTFAYQL